LLIRRCGQFVKDLKFCLLFSLSSCIRKRLLIRRCGQLVKDLKFCLHCNSLRLICNNVVFVLTIPLFSVRTCRCFWFKSRLLLPAVTTLLCRESRESTVQSPIEIDTGNDQRLVVLTRSLRNQYNKNRYLR
jgi:hypothetical protein